MDITNLHRKSASDLITKALLLNFGEIRARSEKLWAAVGAAQYGWRPDEKAFSCLELIRHVLETEYIYHQIIMHKGDPVNFVSPWTERPLVSLGDELEFAAPYRKGFLELLAGLAVDELDSIQIIRKDRKSRNLAGFLDRCAYHEAVHAGQFLSYLRLMGVERPNIWD